MVARASAKSPVFPSMLKRVERERDVKLIESPVKSGFAARVRGMHKSNERWRRWGSTRSPGETPARPRSTSPFLSMPQRESSAPRGANDPAPRLLVTPDPRAQELASAGSIVHSHSVRCSYSQDRCRRAHNSGQRRSPAETSVILFSKPAGVLPYHSWRPSGAGHAPAGVIVILSRWSLNEPAACSKRRG